MKNKSLIHLVRWFCRHLTFNDLASVVPVLQEVLSGSRKMELKAPEDRPPHYRQFLVDPTAPLREQPNPTPELPDWKQLKSQYEQEHGKPIRVVTRRSDAAQPPGKCRCQHCNAPVRYLYLNNGKLSSQVLWSCSTITFTEPSHGTGGTNFVAHLVSHLLQIDKVRDKVRDKGYQAQVSNVRVIY